MPATYNGFGTTYSKHENSHAHPGPCSKCGHQVRLESFDAHLAIAVLMLPVLKLKPVRVIDACPECTQHVALPRATWRAAVDAVMSRVAAVVVAGADAAVVVAFLDEAFGIADRAAFETIAARVEQHFGNDAVVLRRLGIGYRDFERPEQAVSALERSLALVASTEVQEELAFVHALALAPNKTLPLLEHIWRDRRVEGLPLLLLVVDSFQTVGQHEQALRLLDRCEHAFPAQMQHKDVKAQRAVSTLKDANKRVAFRIRLRRIAFPSALKTQVKTLRVGLSGRDRRILAALGVTAVVGYGAVAAWSAEHRPVWLVNGVDDAYAVDVAGQHVELPPRAHRKVSLGTGRHALTISGPHRATTTIEVDDDVPFLFAPIDLVISQHIINPDGTAVVIVETSRYSDKPTDADYSWAARAPQTVHQIAADYAFVPFPEEIRVKSGASATKVRVSIATSAGQAWALLDEPQRLSYLRARLAFDPGDGAAADGLAAADPTDATLALLDAHLDDRPTRVETWLSWHQLALHLGKVDAAVVLERLRKNPDACSTWVEAVLTDSAAAAARGVAMSPPCRYELAERAVRAALLGDLDEARALLATVGAPSSASPRLHDAYEEAQWQVDPDAYLKWSARQWGSASVDRLCAAHHRGDAAAAAAARAEFLREKEDDDDDDDDDDGARAFIDVVDAYGKRNVALLSGLDRSGLNPQMQESLRFELTLVEGKLDEAIAGFDELAEPQAMLVVAAALRHQHRAAPSLLTRLGRRVQPPPLGALLVAAQEPSLDEVRSLYFGNHQARHVTALLAERFGSEVLRKEAWRLAYDDSQPSLFLATRP